MRIKISYRQLAALSVLFAALALVACGLTLQNNVRTAAVVSGETALLIDQLEMDLYHNGVLTKAQHDEVGPKIAVMLEAVQAFVRAAQVWPAGVTMPPDVPTAMAKALTAIADVERIIQNVPGTDKMKVNLDKIKRLIGG